MQKFIVAEISKNWRQGSLAVDLLCQRFEIVINENLERGYKLVDWRTHSVTNGEVFSETIIAIFERIGE